MRSENGSYEIPENRLGLLRAGVAALNKRATKLGFDPIVLVASAPREVHYVEVIPHPTDATRLPVAEIPRARWVVDVRLEGTAPRIAGFTFLARLDHQEAGNLVLRAPGVETDLTGWRETGSRCQHCGLDRRRAATFLLQNEQGAILQVGKSCLVDYTGTTNVEQAVALFKCWQELVSGCEDEDGEYGFGGGRSAEDATPVEFVAAAVASIRRRGFKKTQCEDQVTSTRDHCRMIVGPMPKPDRDGGTDQIDEYLASQPTAEQRELAVTIVAWAKVSADSSDYMHNMRIACGAREVLSRTAGLLASLPVAYEKALGIEQERKARPPAGPHVGTVGERVTLKVTVKYVTGFSNDWSSGVFMILIDENNSSLKLRATGHLDKLSDESGFKDGEWFLRGTIKKHEMNPKRNNEPITVLTRCDMQREPFAPMKPRKVKPASKGKPFYGYLPNGTVGVTAYQWKAPAGVAVSWFEHTRDDARAILR